MLNPLDTRRTPAQRLFHPAAIALTGADTAVGARVLANLRRAAFPGPIHAVDHPADLNDAADLGLIAADPAASLAAFAKHGIGVAVSLCPEPAASPDARLLGPRSFGIIVPGNHLDASIGHLPARPGKLALISPSIALCRAMLDWAEPNGVGFSHIVGTGFEHDLDAAIILDLLAREPGVGAILIDIRTVRDRRAFLSAARAAARLRPVIALHPGARHFDPSGQHDRVFEAVLTRAGILRVTTLAELFAAAEVMTRVPPPRNDRLMIVTNALGAGQLAADQAVRSGIALAEPDPASAALLRLHLPPQPPEPGVIWTGDEWPTRPAEAAAMLSALPEIGGIVAVLAPTGDGDGAGMAALAACAPAVKIPLIVSVLGETTGAVHRRTLAEAGLPAFPSPELAVRGFAQLVAQRHARLAARELPPGRVLSLAPDRHAVAAIIARVRQQGRHDLFQDEALEILSAYGLPVVPFRSVCGQAEATDAAAMLGLPVSVKRRRLDPNAAGVLILDLASPAAVRHAAAALHADSGLIVQRIVRRARRLSVSVIDDAMFGPAIGLGAGGRTLRDQAAYDLPPLNLVLAQNLVARSPAAALLEAGQGHPALDRDAIADALVRVSQLVIDTPDIAALTLDPLFADADGVSVAEAWITLRPAGQRSLTALAPYPAELAELWTDRRGDTVEIRPIRPEDAEAHIAFMGRLSPEDIRYRFFTMLRSLPPEQIVRMTQIDYDREMAMIGAKDGRTIGVARLIHEPGSDQAEFAVVVDPDAKGTGLGHRLMQRIIAWGRAKGLHAVTGQILADNPRMLAFTRRLGFTLNRVPDEPDIIEACLEL